MIHDIDVVLHLIGKTAGAASRRSASRCSSSNEDIANARLEFDDGCVANLTASRVSQERLRRIRFFQSRRLRVGRPVREDGRGVRDPGPGSFEPRPLDPLALLAGDPARSKLEVAAGEPLTLELEGLPEVAARRGRGRGERPRRGARRCASPSEVRDGDEAAARDQWDARPPRRFLIVAGEASGDRHAAAPGATRCASSARCECARRRRTRAARGRRRAARRRSSELAVVGFSGVIAPPAAPARRAERRVLRGGDAFRPHAVRARRLARLQPPPRSRAQAARRARLLLHRAAGLGVARGARARDGRWVDRLAVVFPFEEPMFRDAGVDATLRRPSAARRPRARGGRGHAARRARRCARRPDPRPAARQPAQELARICRRCSTRGARACARSVPTWSRWCAVAPGLEHDDPAAELRGTRGHADVRAVRGRTRAVQAPATALRGRVGHRDARDRAVRHAARRGLPHRPASTTRSRGAS